MPHVTSAPAAPAVTARIVRDEDGSATARTPHRPGRIGRRISSALIILLVGAMAWIGMGAQPAHAILDNPLCISDAQDRGPAPSGVLWGLLPAAGGPGDDGSWARKAVTAYEWWGSSGTTWSWWAGEGPDFDTDDDPCVAVGMQVKNFLANAIFGLAKTINTVSIGSYSWATSADLFDTLGAPVECLISGCGGSKGLTDALYLSYLAPIVVLGALWAGWQGLVKKRSTEALQGGIWMICAAAMSLIFLSSPIGIIKWADNTTSAMSGHLLGSVTSAAGDSDTAALCALPEDAPEAATRVSTCTLWVTLEAMPWVYGQFGIDGATDTVDGYEVRVGQGKTLTDVRWVHLDAQVLDHEQMRAEDRGEQIEADHEQWNAVKDAVVDQETHYMMWAGKEGDERIKVASIALLASLTVGLLVLVIAFSLLVLAVTIIVLTVMAPILLLLGAHPGFGRPIALKWVEMFLGSFVKIVILHAFLMALMVLFLGVQGSPLPWVGQLLIMVGIAIAGVALRGSLMKAMNIVRIPGASQADMSMSGVGKKAASATVGAVSGGRAGLREAGWSGAIQGAVDGAETAARRSSGVLSAARVGAASGERAAAKITAADQKAAHERNSARFATQRAQYESLTDETERADMAAQMKLEWFDDDVMSAQVRKMINKQRLQDRVAPRPETDTPRQEPTPPRPEGPAEPESASPRPQTPDDDGGAGAPTEQAPTPPSPRPSGGSGSLPKRPTPRSVPVSGSRSLPPRPRQQQAREASQAQPSEQPGRAVVPDISTLMNSRPRPGAQRDEGDRS